MKKAILLFSLLILTNVQFAQIIVKPVGCFAGTNGTNSAVLAHPDARGVLLTEKWSDIESSPGIYDFSNLDTKVNTVKNAGLKYALAIPAGAFGSPAWLIDSLQVDFYTFQYQGQSWNLPLWWDTLAQQRLSLLIGEVANRYGGDTSLSHVYVSQMTVNGVEGHLNGVNMAALAFDGYTDEKWIACAQSTSLEFAQAFPDKPIVFEVHEINGDTIVPATIIENLNQEASLCKRLGLGMWWISGKTSYQPDMLTFIDNYSGDKYAQLIGRSDQAERFKDSLYATAFMQAKDLNIRYMEPWPYEFQHHTFDSLLNDFNSWADARFSPIDTCMDLTGMKHHLEFKDQLIVYPNPAQESINLQLSRTNDDFYLEIFNLEGQLVLHADYYKVVDVGLLPKGIYLIKLLSDDSVIAGKFVKD